jgi:anti-sigma B factor antagonist
MSEADDVLDATLTLHDGYMVRLRGEIDLVRSPLLLTKLMDLVRSRPHRLVVDLTQVPLMDSSGVATLIEILQAQSNGGGKLVLCGLQEKVKSVFEITRLHQVFLIVDDHGAACEI